MLLSPAIGFTGDRERAISYKSRAIKFYNYIANQSEQSSVNYVSRILPLDDGSFIKVTSYKDNNYGNRFGNIIIFGSGKVQSTVKTPIYMESGFLYHESNFYNNELSYIPSIIEFNDFVTANSNIGSNEHTLYNASPLRKVINGSESLAVGSSTKVKEIVVTNPSGSISVFSSSTPKYVVDLWKKKLYQTICPPSVFTGKLRLFVQALYGSTRNDYYVDIDPLTNRPYASVSPYLNIVDRLGNVIKLSSANVADNYSSGLYRDPLNKYWLITIEASTVYARKMVYDDKLIKDYNILNNVLNEAYILSILIPDTERIVIGFQTETEGFYSLIYGWKFNQLGNEFSIVVTRTAVDLSTETGVNGIENRLVTLKLSFNIDTNLPEVSSSVIVSSGFHIPYAQTKIWFPVNALGIMQCLTENTPGNIYANLSAPIYCYYTNTGIEEDSSLVVIIVKNGLVTTTSKNYWQYTNEWIGNNTIDTYTNTMYGIYEGTKTSVDLSGITITNGSVPFTSIGYTYPGGLSTLAQWVIPDESQIEYSGIEPLYNSLGQQITSRYSYKIIVGGEASYYSTIYSVVSSEISTILVIPAYDAEAVFIGSQRYDITSINNRMAYAFNDNVWWKSDMWSWNTIAGQVHYVSFVNSMSYSMYQGEMTYDSTHNLSSISTDDRGAIFFNINNSPLTTQNLVLYTSKSTEIEVYRASKLDSDTIPLRLDSLLYVPFSSPFLDNLLELHSSYSGSHWWSMVGGLSGKVGWPVYTNDVFSTPVGWA